MAASSMAQLAAEQINGKSIQAGQANRRGTTLLISRPRDFWPWLTSRRERAPREPRKPGTVLLVVASSLLLVEAAAQGYVSWFAQYEFIRAAKHASLASGLEALGLDTGAVIFALLALALVRLGKRALIERVLNLSCAVGSLAMNVLAAHLASPRSVVIYALPSALYATTSDRLIAVVRRHALANEEDERDQRSAWVIGAKVALYALRFCFALPSTWTGLRRMLLAATPLPETGPPSANSHEDEKTGRERRKPDKDHRQRKSAPSKKSVLLKLYVGHEGHGDPARISRIAAELAPQAGLQAGTARTYLYDHVRAGSAEPVTSPPEPANEPAEVA